MSSYTGKVIILLGAFILLTGLLIYFFSDKFRWIGHLPGDIHIKRGNFRFYFPIATILVLSIIINLVLRIFRWFH